MAGGGPVGAPRVPSLARNAQTQPVKTQPVHTQQVKTQPEDDEEEEDDDKEEEEEEDEWVPDAPINTSVLASISASAPAPTPVPVPVSVPAQAPPVPAALSVAPSLQKEMVAHWETMINPTPLSPSPRYHICALIRTLTHHTYLSYICTHNDNLSLYTLSFIILRLYYLS